MDSFHLQEGFYYVGDVDLSIKASEHSSADAPNVGLLHAGDAFLCLETSHHPGSRRTKIQDCHYNIGWITFETKTGFTFVETFKDLSFVQRTRKKVRQDLELLALSIGVARHDCRTGTYKCMRSTAHASKNCAHRSDKGIRSLSV